MEIESFLLALFSKQVPYNAWTYCLRNEIVGKQILEGNKII